MRFGGGAIARISRLLLALCMLGACAVYFGAMEGVYAQGSTVRTNIDSGTLHPALELTSPTNPVNVTALPISLTGTLSALTQIQVYVDNVFSVTIPLDEGATSFSYALVIPSGAHEVKLVGISPFADNSPTVTFSATYTSPVAPNEPATQPTTTTTVSERGGAVISRDGTTSSSTTYVEPTYAASLPTWFYNGLLSLDLAQPGDVDGTETAKMLQRFFLASSGAFFLFFARLTLSMYRKVRYVWLGFSKRPLPAFMRSSPLAVIRVVGGLLLSGAFWLV